MCPCSTMRTCSHVHVHVHVYITGPYMYMTCTNYNARMWTWTDVLMCDSYSTAGVHWRWSTRERKVNAKPKTKERSSITSVIYAHTELYPPGLRSTLYLVLPVGHISTFIRIAGCRTL